MSRPFRFLKLVRDQYPFISKRMSGCDIYKTGLKISANFLNFSLSADSLCTRYICVYMCAGVYSATYTRLTRIMNLLYCSDIVTVTAIMGYKILPEALLPKKRACSSFVGHACFLHAARKDKSGRNGISITP